MRFNPEASSTFGESRKGLIETNKKLHTLLDVPLRSAGFIPEGKDWTLSDNDLEGLFIHVWAEPRQRGRKKPEIPISKSHCVRKTPRRQLRRCQITRGGELPPLSNC